MSSEPDMPNQRLDEIATRWSLLRLAHRNTVTAAGPARDELVLRYARAIRNYVGALVADPHDADEVAQEAVVRLLQGRFAQADPQRGRFRDLLKVAVKNLVRTYWAKQARRQRAVAHTRVVADQAAASDEPLDRRWTACWQQSVLDLAWQALADYQQSVEGNVFYTLLRLRADFADDDLTTLGDRLATATGNRLKPANLRQQLRRARLRFAQLLIEELARSLDQPDPECVERELVDLELMEYVRDFLPSEFRTRGELTDAVDDPRQSFGE